MGAIRRLIRITGKVVQLDPKPWPSQAGAESVEGARSAPLITEDGISG